MVELGSEPGLSLMGSLFIPLPSLGLSFPICKMSTSDVMPPLPVTAGRWGGRGGAGRGPGEPMQLCGVGRCVHFAVIQPGAGVSGPLWHGLGLAPVWSLMSELETVHLSGTGAVRTLTAE